MAKTKKELLAEARALGLTDVDDKTTNADLEAAIAEKQEQDERNPPPTTDETPDTDTGEGDVPDELDVDTDVDDNNVNADGTVVGTEDAPQTVTPNVEPDPFPHYPETGHRMGEKFGEGALTTESDDGETLEWVDPDAIPGTVGDDPEETMRALHAAGSPAVKVAGE
jgi:hypothetical protein